MSCSKLEFGIETKKERVKLNFFLENEQQIDITEDHKNIVRQRIKASNDDPSRLLNWDDVKHKIKM